MWGCDSYSLLGLIKPSFFESSWLGLLRRPATHRHTLPRPAKPRHTTPFSVPPHPAKSHHTLFALVSFCMHCTLIFPVAISCFAMYSRTLCIHSSALSATEAALSCRSVRSLSVRISTGKFLTSECAERRKLELLNCWINKLEKLAREKFSF